MIPTVPLPIPSPTKVAMANSPSTEATSSIVSTNGSSQILNNTSVGSKDIDESITDLCNKIASSSKISSYGCLKTGTLDYIVKPISKSSTNPREHISLQDLLGKSKLLTRRRRYNIALVLSSSFVQ